jgi:hypothetical protein
MFNLDYDVLREISYKLNLDSILNFSLVNKQIYSALDNVFYKNLAYNYFDRNFWVKAYLRSPKSSKPLKNIKNELIRIELFQKNMDALNVNRWIKKDFYDYWLYVDKQSNRKNYDLLTNSEIFNALSIL